MEQCEKRLSTGSRLVVELKSKRVDILPNFQRRHVTYPSDVFALHFV